MATQYQEQAPQPSGMSGILVHIREHPNIVALFVAAAGLGISVLIYMRNQNGGNSALTDPTSGIGTGLIDSSGGTTDNALTAILNTLGDIKNKLPPLPTGSGGSGSGGSGSGGSGSGGSGSGGSGSGGSGKKGGSAHDVSVASEDAIIKRIGPQGKDKTSVAERAALKYSAQLNGRHPDYAPERMLKIIKMQSE